VNLQQQQQQQQYPVSATAQVEQHTKSMSSVVLMATKQVLAKCTAAAATSASRFAEVEAAVASHLAALSQVICFTHERCYYMSLAHVPAAAAAAAAAQHQHQPWLCRLKPAVIRIAGDSR
jgi:hypothetical protein